MASQMHVAPRIVWSTLSNGWRGNGWKATDEETTEEEVTDEEATDEEATDEKATHDMASLGGGGTCFLDCFIRAISDTPKLPISALVIWNRGKDDFYPSEHWQLSLARVASVVTKMPASTVYLEERRSVPGEKAECTWKKKKIQCTWSRNRYTYRYTVLFFFFQVHWAFSTVTLDVAKSIRMGGWGFPKIAFPSPWSGITAAVLFATNTYCCINYQ